MALNINGTTGISGVDGSASAPAVKGSDANTGVSFGTDIIDLNTGGASRIKIGAAGQLGIAGANYGTAGQVLTSNGAGSAVSWAAASGGKILDIVSTKRAVGSTFSTSSGSPQDFMSLNITTTANDSKVLVISNTYARSRRYPGTETYARVRLVRTPSGGSETILVSDRQFGIESYPGIQIIAMNTAFTHVYLDTPGNAGTYNYKIQFLNDSGGNATAYGYDESTITLLEVSG